MHISSFDQSARQVGGYPEQFTAADDVLAILIPRQEILAAMLARGEERVLDEVCCTVAICADALAAAVESTRG